MKKLTLALLIVALMAMPAFASVQNIKVSGDVESKWVLRNQFDLGLNEANEYQNDALLYTRLRVDADLTDNVSVVVRLLNERVWGGTATGNDVDVELDLAYVEMREMLYSPLTVTVGRQILNYGNGLIIGAGGPNNVAVGNLNNVAEDLTKRVGVDAVKAVLDYDPLTIDIFAAILNSNQVGFQRNDKSDDVNLYGINAAYNLGDSKNSTLEAYFFALDSATATNATNAAPTGALFTNTNSDTVLTPGMRVTSNLMDGLFVSGEVAWQFGKVTNATLLGTPNSIDRNAMAVQLISSYALPFEKTKKYNPILTGAYTYLSGDSDAYGTTGYGPDAVYHGWDPMLETQSAGKIYNSLFPLSNCHIYEVSGQISPMEDVIAKLTWTGLMLDKKLLGAGYTLNLQGPGGTLSTYTSGTNYDADKKGLGNEVDFDLTYQYTEDVTFGMSAGWFVPGSVFTDLNDDTATQLIGSVLVNF